MADSSTPHTEPDLTALAARADAASRLRAAVHVGDPRIVGAGMMLAFFGLATGLEHVPAGHSCEESYTRVARALLGRTTATGPARTEELEALRALAAQAARYVAEAQRASGLTEPLAAATTTTRAGQELARLAAMLDDLPEPAATPTTEDDRPENVTLCGSMRFFPSMLRVAAEETLAGRVVISPFAVVAPEDQGSDAKARLDVLHRHKIDMADRVIVVTDETGYYGESTRSEIAYAREQGKPVTIRHVTPTEEADRG